MIGWSLESQTHQQFAAKLTENYKNKAK